MQVAISAAVMAHPKRLRQAEVLCSSLRELNATVALDPEPEGRPGTLRTSIAAWGRISDDSTHHLVVQDDVSLRPGFVEALREAVRLKPTAIWGFYCNWNTRASSIMRIAAARGCGSFEGPRGEYAPALAMVMPRAHVTAFLEYGRRSVHAQCPDDIALSEYAQAAGVSVWYTVPNLVEHEDGGRSLVGNEYKGRLRAAYYDGAPDFDMNRPVLSATDLECFPHLYEAGPAELITVSEAGYHSAQLEASLGRLGLSADEVFARYDGELARMVGRHDRADVHEALRSHGRQMWLMGFAMGSLTDCGPAASSRPLSGELASVWETLVRGSVYQKGPEPDDVLVGSLVEVISRSFSTARAAAGPALRAGS